MRFYYLFAYLCNSLFFRYHFQILVSPVANGLDDRRQFLADVGQMILDFRRNNGIDRPCDDQVALQLPQLADQHPLVDVREDFVELAQPQCAVVEQGPMMAIFHLPPTTDRAKSFVL